MYQQRFDYLKLPQLIADNIKLNPSNIKRGTGQNAIRKIFKNQDYDQFERNQINLLTQELQRNKNYYPNYHTDSLLLRILYANQFHIQSSFDQLIQRDTILSQPAYLDLNYEIESLYQKGALYIEGRTQNQIPCIVISTKLIVDLVLFERALVILFKIAEDLMFYPGKVESWIVVIQTKDQDTFKMPLDKMLQIIKKLQTCFPNLCQFIYILNSTLSINLLISQLEEQIDPITLNKIQYLKDTEISILSNQFNPQYLEQSLGGQKIIQSYWPPDPNDYLYDMPQQQQQQSLSQSQQQIYSEEPQVYFSQQNNNMQYINQAPSQEKEVQLPPPLNNQFYQPIVQQQMPSWVPSVDKKKKCICVKCSRDLDAIESQPRKPEQFESQQLQNVVISQQQPQQNQNTQVSQQQPLQIQNAVISHQQPLQIEEAKKLKEQDDIYVPYERKYDSVLNDSCLSYTNNLNNQLLLNDTQNNQPQLANSFNNNKQQSQQNEQKQNKQSQSYPFNDLNSINGSQYLELKQQPQIQKKGINQEIQANIDDLIKDDQSDYQLKHINKNNRPYQASQSSRSSNNNQNIQNAINLPSYNSLNQFALSQVPASQQYPSQQYIQTIPYQPQSKQQINSPIRSDMIQQQPFYIQESKQYLNQSQEYHQPQISNDPKKKYDFSQWDKYNDLNDPYPIQSYKSMSNNYGNPYLQTSPYKNNLVAIIDYNNLYDNTGDYKPGEFRPSTYNNTPYDFKFNDLQYQPRVESTTQSNIVLQQNQQKPGQPACQIF